MSGDEPIPCRNRFLFICLYFNFGQLYINLVQLKFVDAISANWHVSKSVFAKNRNRHNLVKRTSLNMKTDNNFAKFINLQMQKLTRVKNEIPVFFVFLF